MSKELVKLLVNWIITISSMLTYQTNIFPKAHLDSLNDVTVDLITELRKINDK